jgi:hypothetical protein
MNSVHPAPVPLTGRGEELAERASFPDTTMNCGADSNRHSSNRSKKNFQKNKKIT